MRNLFTVGGLLAVLLLLTGASVALADDASTDGSLTTLDQPRAAWLTPELEAKIVAAGPKGVDVPSVKTKFIVQPEGETMHVPADTALTEMPSAPT